MNNLITAKANDLAPEQRLVSIDFLRGLVIMLMTVDHTRDMFSTIPIGDFITTALPLDIFLTRFVTHFCAPIFVFLAGLSVFLREQKHGLKPSEVRSILFKRGLFLVILEFTLISFLWKFIFHREVYLLSAQVIWAIGMSMIFLGIIKNLHPKIILMIGLVIICGHNLLDKFDDQQSVLWSFFHERSVITIIPDVLQIRTSYPLLPWFGIISLGYACGYFLFKKDEAVRNKIMLNLGLFSLVIFVILRYFNFYGDSHLFIKENDFVQSLKSFLDVTKYPPSLLYFLLTIPFGLLILAGFKRESFLSKIITNYGRVPLFYYMLHLTLLPTVSYATLLLNNKFYQTDNIGVIWFLAFMIVIIAYPLVVWFIGFRKKYSKKFELLNYI